MATRTIAVEESRPHAVSVAVRPALVARDRLTTALRIVLAVPHLLLVGGPIAAALFWTWTPDAHLSWAGGGALGTAVGVSAAIAWFGIVFTGRHSYPRGLYDFGVGVLQWNMRVEAYLLLLHDEYPPFSLDQGGAA